MKSRPRGGPGRALNFGPKGPAILRLGLLAFLATQSPGSTTRAAQSDRRPNVLILIGDDHRAGTLGIDGDPRKATPHLDALARRGVRFTHAFCNSPVCTPSRQSFITGRLPHAVGVTLLATPLPESARTLGDVLSVSGYATAAIGKMHFNSDAHHGFTTRIDVQDWQRFLKTHPPEGGDHRRPWKPFVEPAADWLNASCRSSGLPAASMESTFFADQAVAALKSHRPEPFGMVVSFYDPHSPFRFPREWEGRYRPEQFQPPAVSDSDLRNRPIVFRGLTDRDAQGIHAAYYSSLSFLDAQLGRVLDALNASGEADNTIVVYLGDNGYMLGEHARFEKHCFYEPAVRVPLIVSWPGHLPENRQVDALVELIDLFPSLLDLLELTPRTRLHGKSLVPLMRNAPGASVRSVVFSEYLENEEAMVRSERYKLIVGTGRRRRQDGYVTTNATPGPYERLYDLQADPGETIDLADQPELNSVREYLRHELFARLLLTRDGLESIPRGLSGVEAIHWCLKPRDKPAEPARSKKADVNPSRSEH
jgi:choline-sulfatase